MPGLTQLKKFSTDMMNLGDEVAIRAARGEKPSVYRIPGSVQDVDDSEDFRLGLPELSEEEIAQSDAQAAEREREANDFSDITGGGTDTPASEQASPQPSAPDVSDLLDASGGMDLDDLDLSDFEEPEAPPEPAEPEPVPLEDMDLDALLAPSQPAAPQEPAHDIPITQHVEPEKPAVPKQAVDDFASGLDMFDDLAPSPAQEQSFDAPAADMQGFDMPDEPAVASAPREEPSGQDFPAFQFSGNAVNMNEGLPSDIDEGAVKESSEPLAEPDPFAMPDFDAPESEPAEPNATGAASGADDFDLGAVEDYTAPESTGGFGDAANFTMPDFDSAEGDGTTSGGDEFTMPDFDAPEPEPAEQNAAGKDSGADDFGFGSVEDYTAPEGTGGFGDAANFTMPDFDSAEGDGTASGGNGLPDFGAEQGDDGFTLPDFDFDAPLDAPATPAVEKTGGVRESDDGIDFDMDTVSDYRPPEDTGAFTDVSNFTMPDFGSDADAMRSPDKATPGAQASSGADDDFSLDGVEDYAAPAGNTAAAGSGALPDFDFNLDGLDFGEGAGGSVPDASESVESSDSDDAVEKFDTSGMEGLDFSKDSGGSDFELASGDDDMFAIPGFSDTVGSANLDKKPDLGEPDFTGAAEGDGKPKNTFTDAEYQRFQQNLTQYPLNVRIALEDLVVKNEFTDDAVFAVLEKVLRKAPARQVASDLEKMLDISLDVPRDFEKRSAAEYEAYKKSFEYQLKNRILPIGILSAAAALVIFGLFLCINRLVYIPLMANKLYKQGYQMIVQNQYPQSESLFDQALTYKPVKKWFFTYAEAYRDHRQYDRATMMYRALLQRYNHDRQAGLDWADMEMRELYNYEEAERVLRREVLDYHINDADALLMLGDNYLEWADEKDASKYDDAKQVYDQLLDLYGTTKQSNTYLARQMRYYIRTDNLRQVLAYKEYFFPLKKALGSRDLTELSGYLLDKRYGTLRPSEESLRFSIEDVRSLLERAVDADPSNPVALYNMGRYFVEADSDVNAKAYLQSSVSAFGAQTRRGAKDTLRYINAYRLLGELYKADKEYIRAEELYDAGLAIFEKEHAESGFESDENVGRLYADVADLDYFVSGQMDSALTNYINAVNNKNDTASVRYRIGYIQYNKGNYEGALGSFIRASETESDNSHVLLSLANTLTQRGDNYAAQGYYEHLLTVLDQQRQLAGVLFPQVRDDQADLVDTYMKASNNLGVIQSRLAAATGSSSLNARALVHLQESMRAWDALTRNQDTMVRLEGSNLAEQNFRYITHPISEFEPEIYVDIPRLLTGEKGFD